MINLWKDIKGYEGKYQVSYEGKIRRLYKSGKTRELTPYIKQSGREILQIGLTKDGIKKEIPVHIIVARTFIGEPGPGQVAYHKNGLIRDNWASNLDYIDRKTLGEMTGPRSRRKAVAKINEDGEIVDVYQSARQAAKENFMSYQTIMDRCNRKVKSPFAPDGYAYAWEDSEISMGHAIRKIKEHQEIKELREGNPFRLAGYNKEDSEELTKACNKQGIPYNTMLATLRSFGAPDINAELLTEKSEEIQREWEEWGIEQR